MANAYIGGYLVKLVYIVEQCFVLRLLACGIDPNIKGKADKKCMGTTQAIS